MQTKSTPWVLFALLAATSMLATAKPAQLKPGLWETEMTGIGKPFKHTTCIDAAAIADSEKLTQDYTKAHCSGVKESQSGNTYITEMRCSDNGVISEQKSEFTAVSANEIISKITSTSNGKTTVMQNHTKRVGDCSAKEAGNKFSVDAGKGKQVNQQDIEALIKSAKTKSKH